MKFTISLFFASIVLFFAPNPVGGAELYIPYDQEYRLHLHDVVQIKIFSRPELWSAQEVCSDGWISLPLIGEVYAVGRTPSQLDRELTRKYGKYIVDPEVAVILREFNLDRIYVGGEVRQPGEIRFSGPLTLIQALFAAGGFHETASLSKCFVIHSVGMETESRETFDVKKIMKNKAPDPLLRPFDVVVLPESRIHRINRYVDKYINLMIPRAFRMELIEYSLLNRESETVESAIYQ